MAGVRQAFGVEILVLGVDFDPAVPGFALRKLEPVRLTRPLQHVALVFGHVAAAETEHQCVHAGVVNRSEDQRGELLPCEGAIGMGQGGSAPAMNRGPIPIEQKPPFFAGGSSPLGLGPGMQQLSESTRSDNHEAPSGDRLHPDFPRLFCFLLIFTEWIPRMIASHRPKR